MSSGNFAAMSASAGQLSTRTPFCRRFGRSIGRTICPSCSPTLRCEHEQRRTAGADAPMSHLVHFECDFDADTLAQRAAVTLPGGIQYAWTQPSRRHLYVATSSGGVGIAPVPGYPPNQHYLAAFRVTPLGELSLNGDLIKLRQRPIHASVDSAGEHLLVAYNFPSNVSVHRIKGDGSIGDEVKQADDLAKGIYFHQIRATRGNKSVLIVARGNNPEGTKPEDPGSLHVYSFQKGVLSHIRKIAPNGGYGFWRRGLATTPRHTPASVSHARA